MDSMDKRVQVQVQSYISRGTAMLMQVPFPFAVLRFAKIKHFFTHAASFVLVPLMTRTAKRSSFRIWDFCKGRLVSTWRRRRPLRSVECVT